jgi:putative proteasome-type protease
VVSAITQDLKEKKGETTLATVTHLYEAAKYIGRISVSIQNQAHENSPKKSTKNFNATFILAGQLSGQDHDVYLIYPEGNFITASPVKPYFQIGETKYGKPILDRIISPDTSLEDAARCAMVSLDSTMRSNLSVGPPLELVTYSKDQLTIDHHLTFHAQSSFYHQLKDSWNEGLKQAFSGLPKFDWENE